MSQVISVTPHVSISDRITKRLQQGELTQQQVAEFQEFLGEVENKFFQHSVITNNIYTRWFSQGTATDEELRHFIKQFSVFSNQFLLAALAKTINASTLQQSRVSR
ncbi:MAG TPA: hypothetical protein V6D31_00805, partial [Candidatus Sericytochromatia bacterium]